MTLKYLGKGWLPGVPARDIADEEADQYGGRARLLRSKLYEEETPTEQTVEDEIDTRLEQITHIEEPAIEETKPKKKRAKAGK